MNIMPKPNFLPLKTRWGYGFGEYIYTYTLMVFMTYFVFFLTDIIGINAATAGTIYFIGMIWDAITDPIIGYVSDNFKWKSNRRRTPFMKLALLPVCIFTVLMFTAINFGEMGTKVYYALMVICFYTFATTYYICYQALGAEMTNDLDQRASMMTIRSGILSLATALASAGTLFLVNIFTEIFDSAKIGWIASVSLWCITGLILGIISIKETMPYEKIMDYGTSPENTSIEKENIFKSNASVFRNKPFIFTLIVMFTCCVGGYGSSSILIYYMTYYANLSEWETTFAFTLTGIAGMATLFIANIIMQKFERKKAYVILIGGFVLSFLILFTLSPGNKMGFYAAMVLWGYGWMCLWALIYTLIADATVVEEYMTGRQKEGTYYGIVQLGLKLGSGIMILIAGMVFDRSGYIANVAQSESSLHAIKFMNSVVPGAMMIISIIVMLFYPLNRKIYDTIIEAIRLKKEGEEYPEISGLNVGGGKVKIKEIKS